MTTTLGELIEAARKMERELNEGHDPSARMLRWASAETGEPVTKELHANEVSTFLERLLKQGVDPRTVRLWRQHPVSVLVDLAEREPRR